MIQACATAAELRKALAEIERAERHGFEHCLAVFEVVAVGFTLADCRLAYSDLIERASDTDGRFNWGRNQNVTKYCRFVDGQLVPLHPELGYPEPKAGGEAT